MTSAGKVSYGEQGPESLQHVAGSHSKWDWREQEKAEIMQRRCYVCTEQTEALSSLCICIIQTQQKKEKERKERVKRGKKEGGRGRTIFQLILNPDEKHPDLQ